MKNLKINTILVALLTLLMSCEDVIEVDVPNGGERLVIEAFILWEKGTTGKEQTIKLSKSTEYFASNIDVPVTGASVMVTNDVTGEKFTFNDQNNGSYHTDSFVPIIGNKYILEINYNGQKYTATETLIPVSEITTIKHQVTEGDEEIEVSFNVYFEDPSNVKNYYLAEFIAPNSPIIGLEASNDELYNGNSSFIEYESEENVKVGDTVEINLQGISEAFYNYMDILTNLGDGGGPFQSTPVKLKGNCKNENNPNEEVLGFFRLSEVSKTNHIVN